MSFEPINTQEEFDAKVGERLGRERQRVEELYKGYISPEALKEKESSWNEKMTSIQASLEEAKNARKEAEGKLSERDAKIKEYETNSVKMRIAHEKGLSYDAVEYLKGEDEASIKESADKLMKLTGGRRGGDPFGGQEPIDKGSSADEAYKEMLRGLTNNN